MMPLAAAADGASLVEGSDTEEGEQFDFDDSDDSGAADTSHLAAETSDVVNTKQPGSDVQETSKPDVNGSTGHHLTGKHSLYHQCSNKAGRQRCIVGVWKLQCTAASTVFMVSVSCVFPGSEVRESPEGWVSMSLLPLEPTTETHKTVLQFFPQKTGAKNTKTKCKRSKKCARKLIKVKPFACKSV